MSLKTPISVSAQMQRPKAMFYFYSPLQTVFSYPTVSDTTTSSKITDITRVTIKSHSLTVPPGANRIRVVVYGYVRSFTGYAFTGVFILNIDGVDVAQASTASASEVRVIDYNGPISPGSHTIRIDGYIEVYTEGEVAEIYVSRVYIVTGMGLMSTTPTDLITFSITYQLLRQGDIRYSLGVRVFVFGNRKTTTPLTLTIPEATGITVGRNNLEAGNDNDKTETILAILTGSITLQEGGEFTVSATLRGNVGASGDIVIVTRILARVQLRRETVDVGEVRVYEKGVAEYFARALLVSVPGGATSTSHAISRRDIQDRRLAWVGIVSGRDVTLHNYRIAVVTPVHFIASYSDDVSGEGFLEWVSVVVWG